MYEYFHLFVLIIQFYSVFMVFSRKIMVKIIVLGNFMLLLWLNSKGNNI